MFQPDRLQLLGDLSLRGGDQEVGLVQQVAQADNHETFLGLVPVALKDFVARRKVVQRLLVGD